MTVSAKVYTKVMIQGPVSADGKKLGRVVKETIVWTFKLTFIIYYPVPALIFIPNTNLRSRVK